MISMPPHKTGKFPHPSHEVKRKGSCPRTSNARGDAQAFTCRVRARVSQLVECDVERTLTQLGACVIVERDRLRCIDVRPRCGNASGADVATGCARDLVFDETTIVRESPVNCAVFGLCREWIERADTLRKRGVAASAPVLIPDQKVPARLRTRPTPTTAQEGQPDQRMSHGLAVCARIGEAATGTDGQAELRALVLRCWLGRRAA